MWLCEEFVHIYHVRLFFKRHKYLRCGFSILQCAAFGDVSPTVIFGTRKGYLSSNSKKISHTHHDFHDDHDHEDGDEGQHAPHVRSFVYKSSRPFQPQRLVVTLRSLRTQIEASSGKQGFTGESKCLGRGILRAKGLVWLATDMKRARYSLKVDMLNMDHTRIGQYLVFSIC